MRSMFTLNSDFAFVFVFVLVQRLNSGFWKCFNADCVCVCVKRKEVCCERSS